MKNLWIIHLSPDFPPPEAENTQKAFIGLIVRDEGEDGAIKKARSLLHVTFARFSSDMQDYLQSVYEACAASIKSPAAMEMVNSRKESIETQNAEVDQLASSERIQLVLNFSRLVADGNGVSSARRHIREMLRGHYVCLGMPLLQQQQCCIDGYRQGSGYRYPFSAKRTSSLQPMTFSIQKVV
ncbi:MAG: hypothetical protein Q9166_004357 [cf. Caloplaca sp. 2 TL-2023]